MSPRIVNILPHSTPFSFGGGHGRPIPSWDVPGGGWVGIVDGHWSNLLCRAVGLASSEFEFEVWQPEPLADREYRHQFDDRLVHVLMPAESVGVADGPINTRVVSEHMLKRLCDLDPDTIVHFNDVSAMLTDFLLGRAAKRSPWLVQNYESRFFLSQLRHCRRFWRWPRLLSMGFLQRRALRKVDHVVVHMDSDRLEWQRVYSGPIDVLSMGLHFGYWVPGDSQAAREQLQIEGDRQVLLSASNLVPKKQIHLIIPVLKELVEEFPKLLCLVVGHGPSDYEGHLRSIADDLLFDDHIRFLGRVDDQVLLAAYQASDLFVSVSRNESGPVSMMKAFACQVPAMSTDTGNVAEFLRCEALPGLVPNRPDEWRLCIQRHLSGTERIPVVNREAARGRYDWLPIGQHYAAVYCRLLERRSQVLPTPPASLN